MDVKPPKFMESETREEFRRKKEEFQSYVDRTEFVGEEVSDNLYRTCKTPLKKKLLAYNILQAVSKQTKPEIIIQEIKSLCTPKVNTIVERRHLWRLKQSEDEGINNFETAVRSKALSCKINIYDCGKACKKCAFNREEDEIKTQNLCNMKDKDLQKDLWMKSDTIKTHDDILGRVSCSLFQMGRE